MIRLAAIGAASTGKSALLNALFGTRFPVDPRARSTTATVRSEVVYSGFELEVIDTAPLDAGSPGTGADAYILVCDKDLVDLEYQEILRLSSAGRPVGVAVNKADMYNSSQRRQLLQQIRRRLDSIVPPDRIASCAADPIRIAYRQNPLGQVSERQYTLTPDLLSLVPVVQSILSEAEASFRVRARELTERTREMAAETSARIAGWLRDRTG